MYENQFDFLPQTMDSKFSAKLSKFLLLSVFIHNYQFKLSNLNTALESYFAFFVEY